MGGHNWVNRAVILKRSGDSEIPDNLLGLSNGLHESWPAWKNFCTCWKFDPLNHDLRELRIWVNAKQGLFSHVYGWAHHVGEGDTTPPVIQYCIFSCMDTLKCKSKIIQPKIRNRTRDYSTMVMIPVTVVFFLLKYCLLTLNWTSIKSRNGTSSSVLPTCNFKFKAKSHLKVSLYSFYQLTMEVYWVGVFCITIFPQTIQFLTIWGKTH